MKNQATTIKILIAICLMFLSQKETFAQIDANLDNQFKNISEQMFQQGNSYFEIVDAVRDGLIKLGDSYDFAFKIGYYDSSCNHDIIKIDNNELPKQLEDKYVAKIKEFCTMYNGSPKAWGSKRSSIHLNEILDSTSSFRTANEFKEQHSLDSINESQHKFFSDLLKQVTKDHLADTLDSVHIVYKEANVFINGKKVKGPLADTYNELAKKDTHYIPSKADKKGMDLFKH